MTPRDVVLIPAYRRPEMLWHCLANIQRARGAETKHYLFRFDQNHDPDLFEVIDDFPFSKEVLITPRKPYQLAKQSYSVLTGYQAAAARTSSSDRLVFMVEEDVLVATDFFEYHEQVHAQNLNLFCSIAVANPNRDRHGIEGGADEYYLSHGDYCSLGVAFRAGVIMELIQPQMQVAYFTDPVKYCRRQFPLSPVGHAFAEQDGLIRRVQYECSTMPIAYPYQARAYHAGFYGTNRGKWPSGNWRQRMQRIGEVIYSDEAMRTFAGRPEWYEDSRPIDLNHPPCPPLKAKPLPAHASPVRF